MGVNYVLSDGRVGVVSIDVNCGVIFNSDLIDGIVHKPANAADHDDSEPDSDCSTNTTNQRKKRSRRRQKKKQFTLVLDKRFGVWVPK